MGRCKKRIIKVINNELMPIREKYLELIDDPNLLNDLFAAGASKVRPQAQELIEKMREVTGITKIV